MRWSHDIMPSGDISCPVNSLLIPKLAKIALEDRKRPSFPLDHDRSVVEYMDNSFQFSSYLRATFYVHRLKTREESGRSTSQKPTVPAIKELGKEFQLRLRDGIRNENRIVFFRPAVNRRRVNIITGRGRCLEWVPL